TNRESPDIIYPLSNSDIEDESLGIHGQFTAHYLAKNKSTPIKIKALAHPDSHTDHLLENVSKWLSEISSNIDVSSKIIPEANKAALTYNYTYGHNRSRPITPVNVGFGVTHVLPVITQLLMAKENDLLIIENPEAHLHPKGQANLARLISLVASKGVQIILETHSDHILNSIRVCTKEGIISKEMSKVYFFQRNVDSLSSSATEISINDDGSVDSWPSGFFDEWDNQLDKLLW
ncbi:AAA family ATPase, partial [Aeromonas hydrophila]|uniref:AAA family ATPase n=2 Tax=Aeromonadaceae TaxID=84642 RepID=UPI002B061875